MADVFNKIKSSFNRGITTISVKASSTLEKTKIRTQIDTLEKDIEKLYSAAGELSYKIWKGDAADNETLDGYFASIDKKKEEIKAFEAEIKEIDERDSEILGSDSENKDAPVTTAENTVQTPAEGSIVCSNCGATYTEAINFCRQCGNKMQ